MIHLAQFSGGKDSTAMLLWMKEQGIEFTPVFCDTGWEHPLTYAYIEEINQTVLDGRLVVLRSEKYAGIEDLVIKRSVPSMRSRFCSQELKLYPLWRYIQSLSDEVTSFVGIRADESAERAQKSETEWTNDGGGYWIRRPILRWTADDCFAIARRHGLAPNPLYLMGASRVGCYPCVFVSLREMRSYLKTIPEIKQRLRQLEARLLRGSKTFFHSGYIPERYCSKAYAKQDGSTVMLPLVDDVFRYLESVDENQLPLFEAPKCMSIYNLCE